MLRINLFAVFLFFTVVPLFAQSEFYIQGMVIDKKTNMPLPFCNVIYPQKNIGTITNEKGCFHLSLNISNLNDTIVFSFLGYEKQISSIKNLLNNTTVYLNESNTSIEEVTILAEKFNVNEFMKAVIEKYNKEKNKNPHIALAHYREKAVKNNRYIMYMESIGYSIYMGKVINWTENADYVFFCENTKSIINDTAWLSFSPLYKTNLERIIPTGNSMNLREFERLQQEGILSEKKMRNHRFQLDSIVNSKNGEIFYIHFKGRSAEGWVSVSGRNNRIEQIVYTTNKYYSWALGHYVKADMNVWFTYYLNTPYIQKINCHFEKSKLIYSNEVTVLEQKYANFNLNENEATVIEQMSLTPYVQYNPELWNKYNIAEDNDLKKINSDLTRFGVSIEEQFIKNSGNWIRKRNWHMDGIKIINELKNNF